MGIEGLPIAGLIPQRHTFLEQTQGENAMANSIETAFEQFHQQVKRKLDECDERIRKAQAEKDGIKEELEELYKRFGLKPPVSSSSGIGRGKGNYTRDNGGQTRKQLIAEVIRQAGGECTRRHLIKTLKEKGVNVNTLSAHLTQMKKAGDLTQPEMGVYSLPESTPGD